jgi:hypothetical protein
MQYPSTFSAQTEPFLSKGIRRVRALGTQAAIVTLMAFLFPPGAHAESWDDMFKGMARDMIEEGKRAIREGNDRSNQNNQQQQPYQQPDQPYQQPQQHQYQQPVQQHRIQPSSQYSRAQIQDIQTRLQMLGYNPGPADGLFGNKTAKAISQFEIDQGLPVTGTPNTGVIAALQSAGSGVGQPSVPPGGDYSNSAYGSTQSQQYSGQGTTVLTGDFANATSAQECQQANQRCMGNATTSDGYVFCSSQSDACKDKLAAQSLTYDQIVSEANRLKSNCENQSVHSTLYDCDCQSTKYIEYRNKNRGQYNRVSSDFYRAGLIGQCYKPQGAYNYAYNSCMHGFPLSSTGRKKTPVQQNEICRCQADEFSNMQAGQPSTNSHFIQQARSKALSKCMR